MVMSELPEPKSANEVRQQAVDWQMWASEESLSYGELAEWNEYFTGLAKKFDLTEEFTENGIV